MQISETVSIRARQPKEAPNLNWGMALPPVPKAGDKSVTNLGGWLYRRAEAGQEQGRGLAGSSSGSNSPEKDFELCKKYNASPRYTANWDKEPFKSDPYNQGLKQLYPYGVKLPINLGFNGVMDAMGAAIQKVWHHEASVDAALAEAERLGNTVPRRGREVRPALIDEPLPHGEIPVGRFSSPGGTGERERDSRRMHGAQYWRMLAVPPHPSRLPLHRPGYHPLRALSGRSPRSRPSSTASTKWSCCEGASPSSAWTTSGDSSRTTIFPGGHGQHPDLRRRPSCPSRHALGLLLAVLFNAKFRGQEFFKAVYFSPMVTSTVAAAMVWWWMYNPQYGIIQRPAQTGRGSRAALADVQPHGPARHHHLQHLEDPGLQHDHLSGGAPSDPGAVLRGGDHRRGRPGQPLLAHHGPAPGAHDDVHPDLQQHPGLPGLRPGLRPDGRRARPTPPTSSCSDLYRQAFERYNFGYAAAEAMVLFVFILGITVLQYVYSKRYEVAY